MYLSILPHRAFVLCFAENVSGQDLDLALKSLFVKIKNSNVSAISIIINVFMILIDDLIPGIYPKP